MKKILLLFLGLFVAFTSFAQITTSSISGRIADESGAELVGVSVVAVHTPTGTRYGSVTDGKGNFSILNLRPGGPYTIKAQLLGYLL